MKRFIFLGFALWAVIVLKAQLRYPVVGHYKQCSAQGMAIWNDQAFLMSDGGRCRVYDLKSAKVTNEFMLASAYKDNHVNNACFGREIPEEGNAPALYITECKKQYRCFVEQISADSSRLIQTIQAKEKDKVLPILIWVTDSGNGFLYAVTRTRQKLDSIGSVPNTIRKYRLPELNEGKNILLTEKDVLDKFVIPFPNILQGAKIRGHYLYIVTGLQETSNSRQDSKRAIKVIDLKTKTMKESIDLTCVTMNEPEDMDFTGGKALLYCGQNGGLYEVKLK